MVKFNCPSCGGEVVFKSRVTVFAVCSYCSSMLVRHDLNLEIIGKMAELLPDMSPLQIGARGRYQGAAFEVVGRLKVGWQDGNWNEWYALFDDGKCGWVAEAQGFWMMSFEHPASAVPALKDLHIEKQITLGKGLVFQVTDIKQTLCQGSEGELPMPLPRGRKATSVDLSGPKDEFACLDYSEDGIRAYIGRYVEFDDFKFQGLREIDGW